MRYIQNVFGLLLFSLLATGAASGQDETITLDSPNTEAFSSFGFSVSGAGDVNGDGTREVLVGAQENVGNVIDGGRAYLFDGADGSLIFTFVSPNLQSSGYFGWSVSEAGDISGDGISDVFIGAPDEYIGNLEDAGHAYVFDGAGGNLLLTLSSPNAQFNGAFGRTVSDAGDVNNDGTPDLLAGAWETVNGNSFAGRAYLFSGVDGSLIYTFESPNPESSGNFANDVSGAGDVNNDGSSDVIIGASWETESGLDDAGRAYVFSGASGNLLYTLVSANAKVGGNFGESVDGAGDTDGDGFADVVVGALDEDFVASRSGRAYIFSGPDGLLLTSIVSPNPETFGLFGRSVSGAGDINGDGFADVVIGCEEDHDGINGSGRAYIMSGLDGSALHTLSSPAAEPFGFFGGAVSGTGDGAIIAGAINEDAGSTNAGRAYVMRFSGAGGGIPCADIGQFIARCRPGGTIQARVRFFVPDHDGQTVTFLVDGTDEHVATIVNQRAQLSTAGYSEGAHTVDLLEPAGCVTPIEVNCPAALTAGGAVDQSLLIPDEIVLEQNYPNPFNPSTTIRYGLNTDQTVTLKVYNSLGQEVATLVAALQQAGYHSVEWNGRNAAGQSVAAGMYLYTLRAGAAIKSGQMLLTP